MATRGAGGGCAPAARVSAISGGSGDRGTSGGRSVRAGDEGNRRLHQRWVKFIDRRKRSTVANVAIARELAGWCWSLAVMED